MLGAIDRLDWRVVRATFAPTVAVDYTSGLSCLSAKDLRAVVGLGL